MFSPHGIACCGNRTDLAHVTTDAVIAVSYFSIPRRAFDFRIEAARRRFRLDFLGLCHLIMACGFTHVLAIVTLWVPVYGIEGIIKALTAAASIVTAAMLWPCCRNFLALPSPSQLRRAEAALAQEGMHRREAEDMLRQVAKRWKQSDN